MSDEKLNKAIIDLWHVSLTALADQPSKTRWDRMNYVRNELTRSYPALIKDMSQKKIWFAIEDATMPTI